MSHGERSERRRRLRLRLRRAGVVISIAVILSSLALFANLQLSESLNVTTQVPTGELIDGQQSSHGLLVPLILFFAGVGGLAVSLG